MRGDLFFFIGILLLFFVVWVASGGPSRPISFAGPYLNPITQTGTTAQAYGDPNAWSPFSSNISIGPGGVGVSNYTGSGSGVGAQGTSARAGTATISRNTGGFGSDDPEEEYVIITAAYLGGDVSLSGWKLVNAESRDGAAIPQGAALIESGRVNQLAPITLAPGEEAVIVTGRSPVGLSFKENKCVGYLEDRQDFHPALPAQCPTPYQEFSRVYRESDDDEYDACERFVRTLPYCAVDTDVPDDVPSSCESFVEEVLTYNGCVAAHKNDTDFTGRTWRVFLGERSELWDRRGTILLLDAENKVVDSLTY